MAVTAKGRRTRDGIVAAAARLMHERGLAATTVEDVLGACGAGRSQLYHYFRGKDALCAAVLEYQFARVLAAQPSLTDESCSDLRRWWADLVSANEGSGFGGCPLGTFAGQMDGIEPLRELYADLFTRWQAAIAGLVTRAQQAGQVPPDRDPDEMALILLGAMQGGTALSHVHRDPRPLTRALDAAFRAVGVS
jgi:TetR/AcrR family transcriptional repressor of nem operon